MTKGVRITLWILSSLAVVWTVAALGIGGTMMLDGTCQMRGGVDMGASGMAAQGAGDDSATMGGMMWMLVVMGLTWLVLLGLDAVFIYLVVTTIHTGGGLTRRRDGSLDGPASAQRGPTRFAGADLHRLIYGGGENDAIAPLARERLRADYR